MYTIVIEPDRRKADEFWMKRFGMDFFQIYMLAFMAGMKFKALSEGDKPKEEGAA